MKDERHVEKEEDEKGEECVGSNVKVKAERR